MVGVVREKGIHRKVTQTGSIDEAGQRGAHSQSILTDHKAAPMTPASIHPRLYRSKQTPSTTLAPPHPTPPGAAFGVRIA